MDANLGVGELLGGTTGMIVSDGGMYLYLGGGFVVGSPVSGAVTFSADDPTPGWNAAGQVVAGVALQVGVAEGGHLLPNGRHSAEFLELGGGYPPSVSANVFYVQPIVCW